MKKNAQNFTGKTVSSLPYTAIRIGLILCLIFSVSVANAQMAKNKAKWVGNIWYGGSEPLKFSTYWNQVTAENAGKWGEVEKVRDQMNWTITQTLYNYCKANGYPFKHHCFCWGSQQPDWIGGLSAQEQRDEVEEWIRLYGEKFPDTDYIDVVNEMFHTTPAYKEACGGNGSTGWDWIVWIFQKARQYCPKAKLLINEYNVIEGWTAVSDYANLANILKSKGLIDGIGIQCHGLESTNLNDVKSRLTQLGNTGLPLYVSELDLDLGTDDNAQKNRYQALFPVLYEHPAVAGITLWGYIQGHHWRTNAWILKQDGTERSALTWIKSYMASQPDVTPSATPTPTRTPTATPTRTPTGTVLKGDANGNGLVDINDALILARYAAGYTVTIVSANSDVNCDGSISILDALMIARYTAGLIQTLNCAS